MTGFTVRLYVGVSLSTPTGTTTVWPPPVAVIRPLYSPSAPPRLVSDVACTDAVPPAGTVTESALSLSAPAGAAAPFGPFSTDANDNVTAASPRLWNVTSRVTGWSSVCGKSALPNDTLPGSATTLCLIAVVRLIRPAPCWKDV